VAAAAAAAAVAVAVAFAAADVGSPSASWPYLAPCSSCVQFCALGWVRVQVWAVEVALELEQVESESVVAPAWRAGASPLVLA